MTIIVNDTDRKDGLEYFATGDGTRIAYRFDGPEDKPVLVLANSIATTLHMWDGQMADLSRRFRVLRYDYRGHGGSDAPGGAYSFDRMGRDVIELLDELTIGRVHFLGLSMGGVVGQWLAIHAPERIDRLILSNTSSYLGPAGQWDTLIRAVREDGEMAPFADMFVGNWFPAHFAETESGIVASFRAMVLATHPNGLAGSFAAIRDLDMRRTAATIVSPTLVIAGRYDTVTLPEHGERLAAAVPGSKLVMLPAVHLPNVELPDAFMNAVLEFLQD